MTNRKKTAPISDYERAVCYYTLPATANPLTYGLIVAYGICLIEALAAMIYGGAAGNKTYFWAGTIAFVSIVLLGIVAFFFRALRGEIRRRRALAAAQGVPGVNADETDDLPDPFADHVLICRPAASSGKPFKCCDARGVECYTVEPMPHGIRWRVSEADDETAFEVITLKQASSFSLNGAVPSQLEVRVDGEATARIRRRFSFRALTDEIVCLADEPRRYVVRQGAIYLDKRLVGRIYLLKGKRYLDVEADAYDQGLLAFLVAMH